MSKMGDRQADSGEASQFGSGERGWGARSETCWREVRPEEPNSSRTGAIPGRDCGGAFELGCWRRLLRLQGDQISPS